MAKAVELIVGLKIPDTTAITALDTIHNMGFTKVVNLIREDYYKFSITDDNNFNEKISKVDVIVNANKNNFKFKIEKKQETLSELIVAVKNLDDSNEKLLSTLQTNLGFSNITKLEKKTLWTLIIDSKDSKKIAENLASSLLTNKHFQDFEIIDQN
tara:strand:+ start:1502 stop:1969 length:468 start_codon:yes stop_codon:yes gene_type:complete